LECWLVGDAALVSHANTNEGAERFEIVGQVTNNKHGGYTGYLSTG